ncbi:hypothetical protein CVT25_014160 [Psilocybe cyanescens]|uniref:Ubiquinol-cytochrome c chaperone domain-containing protein n=1 Tax=Psilocybe cyanescens TaxID=93625 RepID=A0A409XUX7_PSICY|nr:hypothetical protein CVT25_014160 [Psilocybe cyanescens]
MVARSILLRHLRRHDYTLSSSTSRCIASAASRRTMSIKAEGDGRPTATTPTTPTPTPPKPTTPTTPASPSPQPPKKSWLTRQVESSPTSRKLFYALTNALGYGSTTQVAGRRALLLYRDVCAYSHSRFFFTQNAIHILVLIRILTSPPLLECFLPPTFQSWFTITNLHIWMLTVRLRALPPALGRAYQQALIDHFFLDVEDRVRTVLQPPAEKTPPYTFETAFYANPNAPAPAPNSNASTTTAAKEGTKKPRSRAPDRILKMQMKIFKEQWAGMGLSLDLGLVTSDMELAGAVWRNVLGARGAQGIVYNQPSSPSSPSSLSPSSPSSSSSASSTSTPKFRRSVNLVGGEVVNVAKIDLEKEEARDDGSGVHDFAPSEVDKYLGYPEVMLDVVGYVRRELNRLEGVSDEEIVKGDWRRLRFGGVKG